MMKHSDTEIIAASVKSPEEACASISAGAHHLTLPYEVVVNFTMHPLTEQALAEFRAMGVGIPSPSEKELRAV